MNMNLSAVCCPACGATIVPESEKCEFCGNSFSFVLKSGKYIVRKDIEAFLCNHFYEQAKSGIINIPADSETYVYMAIIELGGRPAFLHSRKEIDHIIGYLDMAFALGHNGDAAFIRAYVEYDYFERKCLNRKVSYKYYYELAIQYGINENRINVLEKMLNNEFQMK